MANRSVIVGMAGHIDHGKTALVKALTGIDADRLEEEKRRGITIDIGFAHLQLPDASGHVVRFGFVDVPGHEKFVRNMLAGVGGIDIVLLIIAADEGVKPQTREHFEICKLLDIAHGITVLTKTDKVSPERLRVVSADAEAFVHGSFLDVTNSPMVSVSAKSGAGLNELRRELLNVAQKVSGRDSDANLRLPIDRVFTMKGFGTVVTGTMVAGRVRVGDEVEILPAGKRVRVRGVQVHNQAVGSALAGERTALNLAGVSKDNLKRGMTLAVPGLYRAASVMDARVEWIDSAKRPKSGTRFHMHNYTAETIATMQNVESASGFARLRLSTPMLLLPGDRFILRRFSPVTTIGGGSVLDAAPLKSASRSFMEVIQNGDATTRLLARIERRAQNGLAVPDAIAETGWTRERVEEVASELIVEGKIVRVSDALVTAEHFQAAMRAMLGEIDRFHGNNPLATGIAREELRNNLRLQPAIFDAAVKRLADDRQIEEADEQLRRAGRTVVLKDDEAEARKTIENAFASAGLKVPAMKEVLAALPIDKVRAQKIVTLLLRERVLIKLGDDLVFHKSALDSLRSTMREYKASSQTIDVPRFKEITNVTRKYAIPLLEFLDRERVTRRQGDVRILL